MRKSKEHIKRFLSTVRPSTEKDAERIRQFFSNRKVKVTLTPDDSDDKPRNTITFEQLEAVYHASSCSKVIVFRGLSSESSGVRVTLTLRLLKN